MDMKKHGSAQVTSAAADRAALERWEDEGGRALAPQEPSMNRDQYVHGRDVGVTNDARRSPPYNSIVRDPSRRAWR